MFIGKGREEIGFNSVDFISWHFISRFIIERKILGRLHGEPERHFSALIGYKALTESVDHYKELNRTALTALIPDLSGVDPDDAFSSVPYEKGFNLLFYLETLLGGSAVFEPYLKAHVEEFAHKSITSEEFKTFLFSFYKSNFGEEKVQLLNSVDWDAWFKGEGMVKNNNLELSSLKIYIYTMMSLYPSY